VYGTTVYIQSIHASSTSSNPCIQHTGSHERSFIHQQAIYFGKEGTTERRMRHNTLPKVYVLGQNASITSPKKCTGTKRADDKFWKLFASANVIQKRPTIIPTRNRTIDSAEIFNIKEWGYCTTPNITGKIDQYRRHGYDKIWQRRFADHCCRRKGLFV
jgi:hypothetical protein